MKISILRFPSFIAKNKPVCLSGKKPFANFTNTLNRNISQMSNKIAICQLTCGSDKHDNFRICKELITQAKLEGAKMAFLPEACDYIEQTTAASIEKAEPLDGEFVNNYRKLAADLGVWISIGSFHRQNQISSPAEGLRKNYNTQIVLDDKGEIRSVYDKLHLFEINLASKDGGRPTNLNESDYTVPGGQIPVPIQAPIGVLANGICFDLRYPQMSSVQRKFGAEILQFPSVFTVPTGKAHWEVLLRSRAIENQCYVIASAQVGQHNEKRSSYGHSMVVDPWGKVLADLGEESPSYKIVDIDLGSLNEVRNSMPVLNCARDDLYPCVPLALKSIDQEFYEFGPSIRIARDCVFFESALSIASVNIKPIVPGHALIIPKRVRYRVEDLTSEETVDLFNVSRAVAIKLEKHFGATSINFSIQDGPESGQSVKHVHMHVLPRKKGDFKKDDEIYEHLRNHDKEGAGGRNRTLEEMRVEAARLRQLFY